MTANNGNDGRDPETGRFVDGNPGGGNKKNNISIVSAIKRKLNEECKDSTSEEKKTYLDELVEKIFKKALEDNDTSMMKDIIDRVDGKAKQPITGGDEDDMPIGIEIRKTADNAINDYLNGNSGDTKRK